MTDITSLKTELAAQIGAANDLKTLDDLRVSALGKKGRITGLMSTLGQMDPEERKAKGQALNELKNEIAALIAKQESALKRQEMDGRLAKETIDITLSPRPERKGRIHPISQTIDELVTIFGAMGFTVAEGPDIEDDWHNFTALNFPPGHPAREMQDTFFLPDDCIRKRRAREKGSAHAHFACTDPPHDDEQAAHQDRLLRPHIPERLRHDAHADVPPDGMPVYRQRCEYGSPERLPD
jgi:phenylalanyl-tRNA synthetase alpha chain